MPCHACTSCGMAWRTNNQSDAGTLWHGMAGIQSMHSGLAELGAIGGAEHETLKICVTHTCACIPELPVMPGLPSEAAGWRRLQSTGAGRRWQARRGRRRPH